MSKSLLNGVNEVLKKAQVLDETAGLLTTLTDSARQTYIDAAVQALNEVVDELYAVLEVSKPKQLAESTITLATNDQDYALASDLVTLRREYLLIDETNNHFIEIMGDDGYQQIVLGDMELDDTGLPTYCAIRPTDGQLFMDRKPTSAENGRVYKYRYDKDLELSAAADEFPFTDPVFRAVVPAAAELWKRHRHKEFDSGIFTSSIGRAARLMTMLPARTSWQPRGSSDNATDPLGSD